MKQNRTIMAMPVIVEIIDENANQEIFDEVFDYLVSVDERFSTYKKNSEITLYNEGKIKKADLSKDMKKIFDALYIAQPFTRPDGSVFPL